MPPNFADPESRAAVRIDKYFPRNGSLQLEFANDQIAERIARVNANIMVA